MSKRCPKCGRDMLYKIAYDFYTCNYCEIRIEAEPMSDDKKIKKIVEEILEKVSVQFDGVMMREALIRSYELNPEILPSNDELDKIIEEVKKNEN